MRRTFTFLLLIVAAFLTAYNVWAQETSNAVQFDKTGAVALFGQTGENDGPRAVPQIPEVPSLVNAGADFCTGAPPLTVPGGDQTSLVNNMTESASDPILGFAWGSPANPAGFRTVWYRFSVDTNTQVVIDTMGSNYDTLLAVYAVTNENDPCNTLVRVAGNDDYNGFSSRVSMTAAADALYYVEIADWQSNAPQPNNLRVSLWTETFPSRWVQLGNMPLQRTRHTAVTVGEDFYVVGGQTTVDDTPTLSNRLDLYETDTGNWIKLADMPGVGYSSNDAAYVNGRIYLPSGFDGNKNQVNGQHWAYDLAANQWLTRTNAPWPGGVPFAWSAVIASPAENGYYVAGGMNSYPPLDPNAQTNDEVYFYSAGSDSWLNRPSLPSARYAHTGALVGNRICVAGGLESTGTSSILLGNGACTGNLSSGDTNWTLTGNMNYPRYFAGSAVGPDGKWYVFGGIDGAGEPVSEIDVYDPATNSWSVLDITYDLGARKANVNGPPIPARVWPRGGFVGSTLYAIGGNALESTNDVLSLVEKVFIPSQELRLPIIFNGFGANTGPDDIFADARSINLNQSRFSNFDNLNDVYDVYYFDLPQAGSITARLMNIPFGSDYDIRVYDANKLLWGTGNNIGNTDEFLPINGLPSGRYFVVVERVSPTGDPNPANYQLLIQQ